MMETSGALNTYKLTNHFHHAPVRSPSHSAFYSPYHLLPPNQPCPGTKGDRNNWKLMQK